MQIRHILVTSETGSQNNYWMIFNEGEIINPKLILSDTEMLQITRQYKNIIKELDDRNSEEQN
jgi:hypothetical protein